ncbi:antimicrobial peptide resistance and lipid A acylation protein PagP [Enterobacillus tribolii]|uniref:Lipid A acyltransferase PagP n=2 Tax=Enterobacillus tribolii TaxID=1487935 RepID=A0A370R494_9GAMM|nr:lipid IV(A) palmitoyltransferase PagP [Enterobacillus tribolii]RDK97243.1 antimicrobial peptide resistance and lipid A acylation protein PagP [Enterobacillus tribolii]
MTLLKKHGPFFGIMLTLNVHYAIAATAPVSASSGDQGEHTAADTGFWAKTKDQVRKTWEAPGRELYVPLNTWHNRAMYDKSKTDKYNERPWGIGYGTYRFDENDNWHSIYAMAFLDSHSHVEPIAGYGFQWMWIPGDRDGWRFGAGYTASITARSDYLYIPIPIVLPLLSIEYNRVSVQTTYIPGTYNNGNVLFTWLRWQF